MFELSVDENFFSLNKMYQKQTKQSLGTKIAIFNISENSMENICNRIQMLYLNISKVWFPV